MKKILQFKLKILSRLILAKYQPQIIAITGSMGKTSTKEAIYQVLKDKFSVRVSPKNYNSEIGLPLSIIGANLPSAKFGWLKILWQGLKLVLFKDANYPNFLILEMGVDRPGDLKYLTGIARPKISIVCGVSYSHLEYFGSVANIKKEKQVLVEATDPQGLVILNFDNEPTKEMAAVSKAKVFSYGLREGSDLRARDIIFNFSRRTYELAGVNFKLDNKGAIVPVFMKHVMTESGIYAALAAAAVGLQLGLNLVEIAHQLAEFHLPPGRMNILSGVKNTFIIDDTYNSSPESALLALDVLSRIKIDASSAKYAVLGDMLEIGTYTEEGHRLVGTKAAASGLSCLIAVGERSRDIIRGASEAGLGDESLFYFDKPEEAGRFLQNRLKAGDIILVKGSRGMAMEKVVKEIMLEPERASELLVGQEGDKSGK